MPLDELIPWVATQVATTVIHNWPFLAFGIVTAAALKVYVGTDRIAGLFRRRTPVAVGGSVAFGVVTPFCSCGTTAVILSMLASAVPWAPIVAFMVASPLTSPDELVVSAGLFGWPFALYFFASSIILGIAGGVFAWVAESAGLLANQARFRESALATGVSTAAGAPDARPEGGSCTATGCGAAPAMAPSVGPGAAHVSDFGRLQRWRLPELGDEIIRMGGRMVVFFLGFATLGYVAIGLVPTAWMTTLLGGSGPFSIILAATLGVPFYFSTEASLPLLASLMHGGMGTGTAMAFLITGAGTSIGAITGGLLIARWRVLAIVVGTLWIGAVVLGLVAEAVL